jgi:CRP-like cAMP-binding protein
VMPLAEHFDLVGPGDTRLFSRRLSMAADVASVQFSRTVERRITPAGLASVGHAIFGVSTRSRRTPVSQNSTACWGSLRPFAGELPK